MSIKKNTVVSLESEIYDDADQLLDKTTDTPLMYLHGGYDGIFPLVEEMLEGKEIGESIDLVLSPNDAFGEDADSDLIRIESVDTFPVEVQVGMMFESEDQDTGEVFIFRVTDITNGKVTVDGNHPLVGKSIRFKAKVVDVRDASAEEIAHGHAHDPNGHNHH